MAATEYLTREELEQLLHSITAPRDRLLVRLLYESGCSISELSDLKTSAVAHDGTVHFSDRTATISPELAGELLKQADTYIFHTRQTPNITPKRIQQILKPYIAGVHKGKVTPHILRYTHIIHAYTHGLPLAAIAEQTGLTCIRLGQIVASLPVQKGYSAFFAGKKGVRP
jgi:integrase